MASVGVPVSDQLQDTALDTLAARITTECLPLFISLLKHYNNVAGSSLIQWYKDTKHERPGNGKYTYQGLLRQLQKEYDEELETTLIRCHQRKERCYGCETNSLCNSKCDKGNSREIQTAEDTSWKEQQDKQIEKIRRHLEAIKPGNGKTAPPSSTPSQSTDPARSELSDSDDEGGPEMPLEEDAEGGVAERPEESLSGASGIPTPAPAAARQDPPPSGSPTFGGSQDASAEALGLPADGEDVEGICRRCRENEMDVVLLPCGHFVICSACAGEVNRCPNCNEVIQASLRAYRA